MTKGATVQYIPIIDTIRQLLSKKTLFEACFMPVSKSKYLRGFSDGTLFQNNALFNTHPDALQISFYNDDIELGNVLGSRAGINKLCMFYFMIKNILNTASLQHVHLALVAHSSDIKTYGFEKVMEPLICDLERLEKGVTLDLTHTKKHIFGTIVQLPADNLAANDTAGMVTSFIANHYCRFCKMHATDCR